MPDSTPISPELARSALAVCGPCDRTRLAAMLGTAVPDHTWQQLASQPEVTGNTTLHLTAETAAALLAELEQANPTLYTHLHEQALHLLAQALHAGQADQEANLMAIWERLANRLLLDDPARLYALVLELQDVPLLTAVAHQQRTYFHAVALRRTEQYAAAVAIFDTMLADPALTPELRARTLNSRAVAHRLLGQPERALEGYRESLALWQALGNKRYLGMVRLNSGTINYQLRRYDEAESHLQQAITHFDHLGLAQWTAVATNELGLVYRDRGLWAAALACFKQLINQRRADEAWENVAIGLLNVAEVQMFQGHLAAAEQSLSEALSLMAAREHRIDIHLNLGLIRQAQDNPVAAHQEFSRALSLATEIDRREMLPVIHYHLGNGRRWQGDHDGAQLAWETAVALIESTRQPIQDEGLKISLLGRWQQVYEALVLHSLEAGDVAAAFAWAERSRARAFAAALTGAETAVTTLPHLQAALPADTAVLCYFSTGVLAWDVPLLQAIPPDNPLRAHLLAPPRLLLFVITRSDARLHICPIDPNRFATRSPRHLDGRRYLHPRVLARLYDELLAPAAEVLSAAARLVIIPHGPLHQAPFTAMLQHAHLSLALTFAPSTTWLAHAGPPDSDTHHSLAVGYGRGARLLPFAEREAAMVAQVMTGQSERGTGILEETLRTSAAFSRVLHFACHAHFDNADPLASYLEIGPQAKLTARHILAHWHLRAELVTLSACETGVSHILRGDEPMGLVRAFLHAGATAVLVTQWPIQDLPTYLLMHHFYQSLASHESWDLPGALAAAQRWLRQATVLDIHSVLPNGAATLVSETPTAVPFAAPEHWAGFVIIGSIKLRH